VYGCVRSQVYSNKEYNIQYRIFISINIDISAEDWLLTLDYKNAVSTAGGTFAIQNIFSEIQDLHQHKQTPEVRKVR